MNASKRLCDNCQNLNHRGVLATVTDTETKTKPNTWCGWSNVCLNNLKPKYCTYYKLKNR